MGGVGHRGGGGRNDEGRTHLTFGVTKLAINCLAVFDIYNSDKKNSIMGLKGQISFFFLY